MASISYKNMEPQIEQVCSPDASLGCLDWPLVRDAITASNISTLLTCDVIGLMSVLLFST